MDIADRTNVVEAANHQLPTDKRKKKWRKPKDKPKRPLSAYNLFFQIERQRLIDEGGPSPELIATAAKGSKDKKSKKYGFAGLARHIASKWKDLEEDQMTYYQGLADKEQVRYMKDLVQWKIHEAQVKYDGDNTSEPKQYRAVSNVDDDLSVSSASLATTNSQLKPPAVPSCWSKLVVVPEQQQDNVNQQHQTAVRCMEDSLFGGFDNGTSDLTSIIQELARERAHTAQPATNNHEVIEPLPFTSPVMEFASSGATSMADIYQQISTSFAMPPPSFMAGHPSQNTVVEPSLSPSLQQLRFDLDEEEQDFLIAFLAS